MSQQKPKKNKKKSPEAAKDTSSPRPRKKYNRGTVAIPQLQQDQILEEETSTPVVKNKKNLKTQVIPELHREEVFDKRGSLEKTVIQAPTITSPKKKAQRQEIIQDFYRALWMVMFIFILYFLGKIFF